ncbi:hypothetical protein FRX31_010333 [Thalictrum thalictroides]|uniref:Uncharacterized protein n=1 Tax=Thalictrum thalictroides TaxID=46969 RepID=A0A7J6WTW2_THATH|nr:hypothetical protein FRX31_010333 [Thalictrum thalictroides]
MEDKKIDEVTKTIMEFDAIEDQSSSNNQTKNLDSNGVSQSEDDEELIRLKYESTKRKVQKAYRKAAKKQHKVKTVELHELPKKDLRHTSLHVTHKYFKPPSFVRRW